MTIIKHEINELLYRLFTDAKPGDNDSLTAALQAAYAFGPFTPKVTIQDNTVSIEIDIQQLFPQKAEFDKAIRLCEQGKFKQAIPVLEELIKKNPTVSEFHRILGQSLSELGDQEEAINTLIEALRWNPKNHAALVMMGNIYTRYKNDPDTSLLYFESALKHFPNGFTAANNIAHRYFTLNDLPRAKSFFNKALDLKPDYPNAYLGLAYVAEKEGDIPTSFSFTTSALKNIPVKDRGMFEQATKMVMSLAERWCATSEANHIFEAFREDLETRFGQPVKAEISEELSTPAKMEFAHIYERPYHLIRYRPSAKFVDHLKCHELVHLLLVEEAQAAGNNQLFLSGGPFRAEYLRTTGRQRMLFAKEGYPDDVADKFLTSVFNGITSQMFNAPLDMFIEDYLYKTYPTLRPFQFLSWMHLIQTGIEGVTAKLAQKFSPPEILHASKVLNLTHAFHFRDLFGIDLTTQFQATPQQMKQAKAFWDEYNEYRPDRQPAEEYELVQHWGDDLGLSHIFNLVDEQDYLAKPKTIEGLLESISQDPYGLESDINTKAKEQEKFDKHQAEIGLNMAVVMYMQGAIEYMKDLPAEEVKALAFEFATGSIHGIKTNGKEEYSVASIPGKPFTGFQYLAWYYTAWVLHNPAMVDKLGLDYGKEWKLATLK